MLNNSKQLKALNFKEDKELENYLWTNVNESLKQAVKVTITTTVKTEMEKFRQEFNDKLSFNGYYQRNLTSTLGAIKDIDIPRFRENYPNLKDPESLKIFNEEKERTLRVIAEMHRLGVSQRKVEHICKNLLGLKFSKTQVGKVHKELVKKEEFQINEQKITDKFEYIIGDGIWIKVKTYSDNEHNKAVLLCVLGITKAGKRKILGFKLADSESKEDWEELLIDLKKRGLTIDTTKLFITDGGDGLISAIKHLFPDVKRQSCITHKARSVNQTVKAKNKEAVGKDFSLIYQADSKVEARKLADDFARKWYIKEPNAVKILREGFDLTLTYMDFDKNLWSKLRTTNILEREFREVRRRIKVFDNSFNDASSANRYADSIFTYLNYHYPAHLHTKA